MKHLAPFVLAALAACGAAHELSPPPARPTPQAAASASGSAGPEIRFGRFAAPIPPGFKAGRSRTEAAALMLHDSSALVFLRETPTRVPGDAEGCQGFANGTTADIMADLTGEPIELAIQRAGSFEARAGRTGGCWVASQAQGVADPGPPYVTAALRFAGADVVVLCMVIGDHVADQQACEAIVEGVHEAAVE